MLTAGAQRRLMFTGAYTQAMEISQCAEARADFDLTDTFTVLLQVRHMAMQVTVTFVKFTNLTSLSGGSARVWPHAQISWVSEQVKLYDCKAQGDVSPETSAGCVAPLEERPICDPRNSPLRDSHGGSIVNVAWSTCLLGPCPKGLGLRVLLATCISPVSSPGNMVRVLSNGPLPQLVLDVGSVCITSLAQMASAATLFCCHVQGSIYRRSYPPLYSIGACFQCK